MKPRVLDRRWVVATAIVSSILYALPPRARAELVSSVTFENKSGQAALVKLVGPTAQTVDVPDGQSQSAKVAAGKYYILVRYGVEPDKYRYTRGEPFDVEEKTTVAGTEYSRITITLHPVIAGNYSTAPSSKEEFEKAIADATARRETGHLPEDLVELKNAQYASWEGLASGSAEAHQRQREAVQLLGLPLEVKTRKTGIVLRLIPAGTFTMGSPRSEQDACVRAGIQRKDVEEERQHEVRLTEGFYCGKFEVTQGQWEAVMGSNPSEFKNAGKDAPVDQVNWEDCRAFLEQLCEKEGVPEGTYRLLTEARWEYACRAGTQRALYNGPIEMRGRNDAPALDPVAWYGGNSGVDYEGAVDSSRWPNKQYNHSRAGTHPVGQKQANAFGLYDMIGNVMEWCEDWYGAYISGEVTDPLGSRSGAYRVFRGGSWGNIAGCCRSAGRGGGTPGSRRSELGLRLSRSIPTIPSKETKSIAELVIPFADLQPDPDSTLNVDVARVFQGGVWVFATDIAPKEVNSTIKVTCGKEIVILTGPTITFESKTSMIVAYESCRVLPVGDRQREATNSTCLKLLEAGKAQESCIFIRVNLGKGNEWVVRPRAQ